LQLTGLVILAYFLWTVDWDRMLQILQRTHLWLIVLAFGMSVMIIAGKSWRWVWLLRRQDFFLPGWRAFGIYYASVYLSFLTPGKIGDLAKVQYLHEEGLGYGRALVSIVLDRLLDMLFLAGVGAAALLAVPEILAGYYWLLWILAAAGLLVAGLVVRYRSLVFNKIVSWLVPRQWRRRVSQEAAVFMTDTKALWPDAWLISAMITALLWGVDFARIWVLAMALDIPVTYLEMVLLSSVVSLLAVLPLSPSGTNIGTRDAALILGFSLLGIGSREEAISLSMLILLGIVFDSIVGYIAFRRIPLRMASADEM